MKKIILIFAILLTSCGYDLTEGRVIDKQYKPPYSYMSTTYMLVGKVMVPNTHRVYVNEKFQVTVKGFYDGDSIVESHEIGETFYSHIKLGDHIKF